MSNYAKLKKLDEESLQQLKEGTGPVDECICSMFHEEEPKKSLATFVKKALRMSSSKAKEAYFKLRPDDTKTMKTGIHSVKEEVKRDKPCGKCGCDSEKFVLKHTYANIRVTTPDISSICPCSSDCLPNKDKLSNIKVIVERADVSEVKIQDLSAQDHQDEK
ncbi:uncharacterized protein LOC126973291 [Leptidea sinapis]|nr:uncharacterized protein LOC126973291 [Leptidea sinapis]